MIKVAICDDTPAVASYLEECIEELPLKDIGCEIYTSGSELLRHLEQETPEQDYNIYFMDIEMPGLNGIETAARLRAGDSRAIIIFITSHRDYVYQVFEVQPFRFLTKPLTKDTLHKTLREAIDAIQSTRALFFFKVERDQYQIPCDKIYYFESRGRRVRLVMMDGEYEFYDTLRCVKDALDPNFFTQIHASYIANMEHIKSIDEKEMLLVNGTTLPISKKYRKEVRKAHLAFMSWRCGG